MTRESMHFAIVLAITGVVTAALLGWLAASLIELAANDVQQRERLRALEQVQHAHSADGAPYYPPHWRPR